MAAFSGISYVTDTLFAVFSLNVTYYGFYNWFERQISQTRYRQDETKLPFKLAELYKYHRDKLIGNWMKNFGLFMGRLAVIDLLSHVIMKNFAYLVIVVNLLKY